MRGAGTAELSLAARSTCGVGDIASLELGASSFDRIFSVHSIYFWRDVDAVLAKRAAALLLRR